MTMPDWHAMFVPALPLVEIVLRGTLVYLALFLMLRLLPQREIGSIGVADLLMIVLIADAAQNALGTDYRSVTEGVTLVATILFWSHTINWLDYRFPELHLVSAPPLLLVRNGHLIRRHLEREQISEEELMGQLRESGADSLAKVGEAYLEGDGKLSVILRKGRKSPDRPPERGAG